MDTGYLPAIFSDLVSRGEGCGQRQCGNFNRPRISGHFALNEERARSSGVAQAAPAEVAELIVVGDAQRGDLFVGRYRRNESGDWFRQGEIEMLTDCVAKGASDYLLLPTNATLLKARVRAHLQRKRLQELKKEMPNTVLVPTDALCLGSGWLLLLIPLILLVSLLSLAGKRKTANA